jgi:hypothetical protein
VKALVTSESEERLELDTLICAYFL